MITTTYKINDLIEEKKNGYIIILYGAGITGAIMQRLFALCGVYADLYVDNNPWKRDRIIGENLRCVSPEDISDKDKCIVFICIAWEKATDVYTRAISDGFSNVYHIQGLIDDVLINRRELLFDVLQLLYEEGISNAFTNYPYVDYVPPIANQSILSTQNHRIAVYTSVFGAYDEMYYPRIYFDNVDYYYVSDEKPDELGCYKWIDASSVIPSGISSPIKRNRYVKMHPHILFPEYEYSIYIDGIVEVTGDVRNYFKENPTGISVFKYYNRDCLYYEALQMANYKRVSISDIYQQITRYLNEGYPLHYGMTEMPVIARVHHKRECKKIMEDWWSEFDRTAQRDQLSFMYVMWRNGYSLDDLGLLGTDFRKANEYIYHQHISDSKNISNTWRNK